MLKHKQWFIGLGILGLMVLPASTGYAQQSTLDVGIRIQKSASFYFENGVSAVYSDQRVLPDRLFLGASFVSSRFGSALGSNAIKQDTFLLSAAWYLRQSKSIRPFGQINVGFFRADYEEEVFDVLPNTAFILTPEIGLRVKAALPLSVAVSAGYNLSSGNGESGPGTLYPVFVQLTTSWRIVNP